MKKIPGARYVVYRTHEQTHNGTMKGQMKRIGMVKGLYVHMLSCSPGYPVINRKGRLLEQVEVIRDATPREVSLGMAIHS